MIRELMHRTALPGSLAHNGRLGLREQRQDGDTRVTTNDWDLVLGSLGWLANDRRDKGGSSDNVEVGNTKEPEISASQVLSFRRADSSSLLGVIDTGLLQDLGKDWDGRVDGVGNDQDEGFGAGVGDGLGEGCTDTSVDLQSALSHSHGLTSAHFLHWSAL